MDSTDADAAAAAVTELAGRHGGTLSSVLTERVRTTPDREALRFIDYSVDRHGVEISLTYAELDRRVSATAAVLAERLVPGDRVAVMTPQGIEFVVGFLGVLRAGLVGVPLFSPDLPGHGERLAAVVADCRPALALASSTNKDLVRDFVGERVGIDVLVVDEIDPSAAEGYVAPEVRPSDIAYLQYTSGSTRLPTGVRITHGNIVNNAAQAVVSCAAELDCTLVSWLPLFHDMGLVFVVGGSLVGTMPSVFLDPLAFLMKPMRWLNQLASNPRVITPGPNFAYEYCAKRVSEADRAKLDLSGVHVMFNGAEPIAAKTLSGFYDAFASAGLRRGVIAPSYGLAEATVYVSADVNDGRPQWITVDSTALGAGRVEVAEEGSAGSVELVSCGSDMGRRVAIADPATATRVPEGTVGEIWVNDDSVGAGYWSQTELSERTFNQTLHDSGDLLESGWLRSGDLGTIVEGRLFVTGRIKDLIIVDGRNHYPQDVERTVEESHQAIGHHRTAAFAISGPSAGEAGERAVVVAEISRHHVDGDWDPAEVRRTVAAAVSRDHGLALAEILLIAPDTIPRTTSGKIARTASREAYDAGSLPQLRTEG